MGCFRRHKKLLTAALILMVIFVGFVVRFVASFSPSPW